MMIDIRKVMHDNEHKQSGYLYQQNRYNTLQVKTIRWNTSERRRKGRKLIWKLLKILKLSL